MYYEFPNITHGMEDLFIYSNTVTNDWFGVGIIIGTFIILFMSMMRAGVETKKAFVASSFSITLLTYVLVLIPEFISPNLVAVVTMLTAVSAIVLYRPKSESNY